MANDRTLRYTVKVDIDYFKRRIEEASRTITDFTDKVGLADKALKGLGDEGGFEKGASGAERLQKAIAQVGEETRKLKIDNGIDESFDGLLKSGAELHALLRELNKEKEVLARGGVVKLADSNTTKSLETVLAQIKAVEDEQKRIKNLDLNNILGNKAKAQMDEVTAAIRAQEKAMDALSRSVERHKALAQSTYEKYRAQVNHSNAILSKYGMDTQPNPYGERKDWGTYAQKLNEEARQVERIKQNVAETRAAINARTAVENGTYTGNAELKKAWSAVSKDAEKWTIAMSKGKQLTDDELQKAQRITEELRKQAQLAGIPARKLPASPIIGYSSAAEYNKMAGWYSKESKDAAGMVPQTNTTNNANQLAAAIERCKSDAEKWTIAMSKGKQITDEELERAKRITEELQKQAKLAGAKNTDIPNNPILGYSKASDFNASSTARALAARTASDYNGEQQRVQAYRQILEYTEKWRIAMSKGKQITDEELQAAQRRAEILERNARQVGVSQENLVNARNPVLDYNSANAWNEASKAAKDASAIGVQAGSAREAVRSYSQEINRLKAQCESLYATYRKNPTEENLQAFAQVRAALRQTEREYAHYQKRVEGASRSQSEWARKITSHLQWITSGAVIGGAMMAPGIAMNALTDIDYSMAGIRQVIPQIEVNPADKDSNPAKYAEEVRDMNAAMTDFISIASKYGQSVNETMESARSVGRMYGQGANGVINTKIFTDQAAKMAVADAFSMEDATKGLEAAMSQWNLQTQNSNLLLQRSSEIIDIWTRAAHSGAASGQDISQAIQVAGASAAQAGVSFQFFTALVETGVRATARSGNEIGQALKSLFITMGNGKAQKALDLWGIKTKEIGEDGKEHVRSLEKQILDVSLAVSSTTKDTTKFISKLAGGRHICP